MTRSGDLKKHIGKKLKIEGRAFDSKAGAIVLTEDELPVYVHQLPSWPMEMLGKAVIATGTLRYEEYIPKAHIDPSGAISQGIDPNGDGKSYVLNSAKWELKG
jgi:hypothetical protein